MKMYEKAILLVTLVATNCALASEQRNSSGNAEAAEKIKADRVRYGHFDARVQSLPKDPSLAKSIEVEPLIRALRVQLEPDVEAPDFDLPVLLVARQLLRTRNPNGGRVAEAGISRLLHLP